MNGTKAFCPQCKNEVAFQKQGGAAQCPVCGFQYALSEPPYRGPFQPGADQTENPFVRSFKIMAVALLVLAGVGALLLGILFVGCALAVRG